LGVDVPLQIVCVERSGRSPRHRHVTVVGVATGNTFLRFSVKTVRQLIKKGTVDFYCVNEAGDPVRVRRFRCSCGRKTIRTRRDDMTDGALSELSMCRR
jgi:hypothetical protein